ncbi:MAG TPA: HEAT repeat domain-containing protein, partial [Blastocatellia bacterium]|nr:HEAT repeat domain-containing protein [Blastocatellia bacterium]
MNVKNISATSKLSGVVSLLALPSMLTEISAQNNKPAHSSLVALGIQVEKPVVRFGDPLKIKATIQNNGNAPLLFSEGSLNLRLINWSGLPGNGSGWEEGVPLMVEGSKGPIRIAAGDTVTLFGTDSDTTIKSIGQMKASYELRVGDMNILTATGRKNNNVHFEVGPSEFMVSVWTARTDAERNRILPALCESLKLQAKQDEEWRESEIFKTTLRFLGGYAIPLFEAALQNDDPVVRQQALLTLPRVVQAVVELNSFLNHFDEEKQRPGWASGLTIQDRKAAEAAFARVALAALNDPDSRVRVAAIYGLKNYQVAQALEPVKKLASDSDSGVRSAAQGFLSKFGNDPGAVETMIDSLSDADAKVREEAIDALEHSPEPPPLQSLKRAFQSAKQDIALRMIYLMFEQES